MDDLNTTLISPLWNDGRWVRNGVRGGEETLAPTTLVGFFLLEVNSSSSSSSSRSLGHLMMKIRGIYKGIKCIPQIFVFKDHEMEIGNPTDVKHVAHIGWDSAASNAPSWMNEFKTTTTTGAWNRNSKPTEPSWNFQDFEQQRRSQTTHDVTKQQPPAIPKVPNKTRRRRRKNSSPSVESSTSVESYATALEGQESLELTEN